ncbi:MAG: DNA translocase FtsK 4TM domain-containing protein [bacterium]|nr:DNA translocase FtsK 4TM domain-containing protein [bacterium]
MKEEKKKERKIVSEEQFNELIGIILIFIGIFLLITLVTYDPEKDIANIVGKAGKVIAHSLFWFLGWATYLIPAILIYLGVYKFLKKAIKKFWLQLVSFTFTIISVSTLFGVYFRVWENSGYFERSGFLGKLLSEKITDFFGVVGSYLVIILLIIISLIVSTEIVFSKILMKLKDYWIRRRELAKERGEIKKKKDEEKKIKEREEFRNRMKKKQEDFKNEAKDSDVKIIDSTPVPDKKPPAKKEPEELVVPKKKPEKKMEESEVIPDSFTEKVYEMPDYSLFKTPHHEKDLEHIDILKKNGELLKECLTDFGITASIENIIRGPVISRYEIRLAPGIKVSRISNLSDDIAYAMGATRVRVIAPIPGKTAVGIEVPNPKPDMVFFKELISTQEYQDSLAKSVLTIAIGKDIEGKIIIDNLKEMPHLLIAGTTGSGKSVFMNNIILSIISNASPNDLRLVLIDPKRVEFSIYKRLPHLLMPVQVEPKKSAEALKKITMIMDSRLRVLGQAGARDISIFNEKVKEKQKTFTDETPVEERMLYQQMPYIVVIIDELADLMISSRNEVEEYIMRISQLARAVGIHLIVATQRPSVDVITGVIKANLLARVAFQVTSKVDSRTILDMNGAEKLMGKGDMLYIPPGQASPIRIQAAYIYDEERKGIVNFWKNQGEPAFEDYELAKVENEASSFSAAEDFDDDLYEDAVEIVLSYEKPSASFLQRRLKIGYNRAARLIEIMEEEGLISQMDDKNRREILISWEDYKKKKGID